MNEPRVLLWDLETAGLNSFRADMAAIVVFGYKWLGEDETYAMTIDENRGWFSKERGLDDEMLCARALQVMEEADILVAHYGDKFDRRFFQGRLAIHNLTPPPPTKQRDTCLLARRYFSFSSNRLANLAKVFKLDEQKMDKGDGWPTWWTRTLAGDKEAIHLMSDYCKQDVRTLEAIYKRIRMYDNAHPRLYKDRSLCRVCGSDHVQYRGVAYVGENIYRRYRCESCGKWDRETRAVK